MREVGGRERNVRKMGRTAKKMEEKIKLNLNSRRLKRLAVY
jgi:hypothetical protein